MTRLRARTAPGFTVVEMMAVLCAISVMLAVVGPRFLNLGELSRTKSCVCNLKQIDAAKKMYALDMGAKSSDTPAASALVPFYLPKMPACASGGAYSINPISSPPTCSLSSPGAGAFAQGGLFYHGITGLENRGGGG